MCVFQTLQDSWDFAQSAQLQEEVLWETLAQSQAWVLVSWLRLLTVVQSRGTVCGQVTAQAGSQCFEADENKS